MLKWLFKWALRLLLLALVLGVIFLLSLDSILRLLVEHNIRQQKDLHGMRAEIGKFHLGLLEPVVEIKNLQLYNPPEFGGTPFLNIPEIYVEYDRAALRDRREIHLTLLRFNLGELDVVKGRDGQTNLFAFGLALPARNAAGPAPGPSQSAADLKQLGVKFKGIDCLNVSVGTFKYLDLQDPGNNREQKIAIENCVLTNVTSMADLFGLGVVVGLRSDDFFRPLIDPNAANHSPGGLLKFLGR
jgi:hypothetical protein